MHMQECIDNTVQLLYDMKTFMTYVWLFREQKEGLTSTYFFQNYA